MALVCGLRHDGAGRTDKGINRAGFSLRCSIFLFADHWRMEAVARVPSISGECIISGDWRAVAHSCRIAKSRNAGTSRISLVLFRQRTFFAISRKAVSEGLQQASGPFVLELAPSLAFSLEFVSASSSPDSEAGMEGSAGFGRPPVPRRFCGSNPPPVLAACRSCTPLLCHLNQPGVLHVPRIFTDPAAARRWNRALRASRM